MKWSFCMFKIFIILSAICFSDLSLARVTNKKSHRNKFKRRTHEALKTTAVSVCKREMLNSNKNFVENKNNIQSIIVAIENESETKCKAVGKKRTEQYSKEGWVCTGLKKDKFFTCAKNPALSFAVHSGVSLDYLFFTNANKHHSLIGYINPNSFETCLEDKKDLESGGMLDVQCIEGQKR